MEVARNWLGKSKPDVAKEIGIAPATYEKYERGTSSQISRLELISDALCVSENYLTNGPLPFTPAHKLSYRKRVAIKSQDSRHVQAMASVAPQFEVIMDSFIAVPDMTAPFLPISAERTPEDVAQSIRRELKMPDVPLRNAIDFAESMGVLVFWVSTDSATFDGVSFWANGRPFILLNSNQQDGYRMRFTVLHELCHIICHRTAGDEDQLEEETKLRDREADQFASAFLMPPTSFARRFPKYVRLGDLLEERRYWMASCAAMVRRARDLRMIDEDHYRRLCVGLSKNGWRKGEPGAAKPERSRVHSFFLDEAGDKGLTPAGLAANAHIPLGWLREAFPEAGAYQHEFTFEGL